VKLKIRQKSQTLSYSNIIDGNYNFPGLIIKEIIKYIVIYGIPDGRLPNLYKFGGPEDRPKTFTTGYLWITVE
jgi:hypothetical protein